MARAEAEGGKANGPRSDSLASGPTSESGRRGASVKLAAGPRRWLFVALGVVFVGLGAVGVVLPGVPTTPFLLVASYFLIRSSPSLHGRLMRSKTFGPILEDWNRHRAIRRRVKRIALACAAAAVCLSVIAGGLPWVARIAVVAAGAYGIYFVWRIPALPDDEAR